MAGEKRRGRRAHLRDFKLNGKGEYVYTGKYMAWPGDEKDYRRHMVFFAVMAFVMISMTFAAECLASVPMSRYPLTAVFWFAQMVPVCLTVYAVCKMIAGRNPMRSYVYDASVGKLPGRALFSLIFSGICALWECVYLIINGPKENLFCNVARPVMSAFCACAAAALYLRIKKIVWEKSGGAHTITNS